MGTVLMPLPDRDFDTTEVAVPWRLLTDAGHTVVFATEHGGTAPAPDALLLSGVVFKLLGAAREPKRFYAELLDDPHYRAPLAYLEAAGFYSTFWRRGRYCRPNRKYVQTEVRAALASRRDFKVGPPTPLVRGTATMDWPAFVVEDGNYVSARWPGDAYLFASNFLERL